MEKRILLAVIFGISLSLGVGCSSSPEEGAADGEMAEDEAIAEELPVADTDIVPEESIEELDEIVPEEFGAENELALNDAPMDEVPLEEAPPVDESMMMAEPEPAPMSEYSEPAPMEPAGYEPPPAPTMASNFQGSGVFENYTVQKGDTLMKIAFETYGDLYQWRKIYEKNQDKISNPNMLASGTVLQLERPANPPVIDKNGEPYMIRQGDSLGTIAKQIYGTSRKWKRLWENNPQLVKDPNRIYAGFYLYYTFNEQDRNEREQYMQSEPIAAAPEPVMPEAVPSPVAGTQDRMPAAIPEPTVAQ